MKKLEKLTKEHALEMIQSIDRSKWDDEAAHYMEDELRADFIYTCSLWGYTRDEMIEIANIVLESNNIEFERWCA